MTTPISVQQVEPIFEQTRAMVDERMPEIAQHVIITRLRADEQEQLTIQLRVTDIAKTTFTIPRSMLLGQPADPAICDLIAAGCDALINFARTLPAYEELRRLIEKTDSQIKRFEDGW